MLSDGKLYGFTDVEISETPMIVGGFSTTNVKLVDGRSSGSADLLNILGLESNGGRKRFCLLWRGPKPI